MQKWHIRYWSVCTNLIYIWTTFHTNILWRVFMRMLTLRSIGSICTEYVRNSLMTRSWDARRKERLQREKSKKKLRRTKIWKSKKKRPNSPTSINYALFYNTTMTDSQTKNSSHLSLSSSISIISPTTTDKTQPHHQRPISSSSQISSTTFLSQPPRRKRNLPLKSSSSSWTCCQKWSGTASLRSLMKIVNLVWGIVWNGWRNRL